MLNRIGLIVLLVASSATCGDETDQTNRCGVSQRCLWNPETQQYDRNCELFLPDAAACLTDAGAQRSG
jgi:hypothetical protein